MPAAFEYYTDRVELTWLRDGSLKWVDVTSVTTASTVGVVLQLYNAHAVGAGSARTYAIRSPLWSTAQFGGILGHESDLFCLCPTGEYLGDGRRWVRLNGEDSNVKAYIVGAFQAPGAVFYSPSLWEVTPATLGIWQNRVSQCLGWAGVPTAECEASLIQYSFDSANIGDWGLRDWTSTATHLHPGDQWARTLFCPVRVTNYADLLAIFQSYTTGKDVEDPEPDTFYCRSWELGFVRKGYGFRGVNIVADEGLSPTGGYTLQATSAQVPDGAEGILAVLKSTATNERHGLREDGSSNPVVKLFGSTTNTSGAVPAALNSSDEFEYDLRANPGMWVYAYTLPLIEFDPVAGVLELTGSGEVAPRAPLSGSAEIALDASAAVAALAPFSGAAEIVLEVALEVAAHAPIAGSADLQVEGVAEFTLRAPLAFAAEIALDATLQIASRSLILAADAEIVLDATAEVAALAQLAGAAEIALDGTLEIASRALLAAWASIDLEGRLSLRVLGRGAYVDAEPEAGGRILAAIEIGGQLEAEIEIGAALHAGPLVDEGLEATPAPAPQIFADLEAGSRVVGGIAATPLLEAAIETDRQVDAALEVGPQLRAVAIVGALIDAEIEIGAQIEGSPEICSL
jgi:hypothetical protein